jgi:hypothetical protein
LIHSAIRAGGASDPRPRRNRGRGNTS